MVRLSLLNSLECKVNVLVHTSYTSPLHSLPNAWRARRKKEKILIISFSEAKDELVNSETGHCEFCSDKM